MGLDTSDFKVLKRIANGIEEHNQNVVEQNQILLEILQQMKYLR